MNKKQLKALSKEELIVRLMGVESNSVKQENSKRGVTNKLRKEYKDTVEEVAERFELNLDTLINGVGSGHWWNQ